MVEAQNNGGPQKGEVLLEVKNLKMYFPVTAGILFQRLVAEIDAPHRRQPASLRPLLASARPLTVPPYQPKCDWPTWQYLRPVSFTLRPNEQKADWYFAQPELEYDPLLGLKESEEWQTII